jgi:hypothetical protein
MDGYGVRGVGAGAICMTCHNGVERFEQAFDLADTAGQRAPHASTQTDVLIGKGAETFGEGGYPTSAHLGVPNTCVGCHMVPASSPFILSGGHTVALRVAGAPNLNACKGCHGVDVFVDPLTDEFNRLAYGDYDGDGVLEGIQDEVGALADPVAHEATGLVGLLWDALAVRAAALFDPADTEYVDGGSTPTVVVAVEPGGADKLVRILKAFNDPAGTPECDPALGGGWPESCFAFPPHQIPADTLERQRFLAAAWNLFYVANDRSRGIHNTAFEVSVLQRSYRAVTGVDVPGATLR